MDYKEFMYKMYIKELEAGIIKPERLKYTIDKYVSCKCGGHYTKNKKIRHFATIRHIKYLENETKVNPQPLT